jgi:hypothetical protein
MTVQSIKLENDPMPSESIDIVIEAAEDADLTELLEAFYDSGEVGGSDIVDLKAIPSETSFVGSGMAEIIQLVVVLGSSGAIAAITSILLKYFDTHPTSKLKWSARNGPQQETIEASNIDASTVKAFLERH